MIHVIAGQDYRTDYTILLYKQCKGRQIFFSGGWCPDHKIYTTVNAAGNAHLRRKYHQKRLLWTIRRERVAEQWWNEMYRKWAEALGLVIVLKAPIQTMIERIRAREQQFEFGDMEDEEAIRYLESIQRAQEHVLLAINAAPHGPKIVQFDTVNYQPDQIATEISALTLA